MMLTHQSPNCRLGTVGGGASAKALATSQPRVIIGLLDMVTAQNSCCAGCSTQAAQVLAKVAALPCRLPPLQAFRFLDFLWAVWVDFMKVHPDPR
jgi:bacterioferritin-associated ferredoxin